MRKGQNHGMRFAIFEVFRVLRGDNCRAGCRKANWLAAGCIFTLPLAGGSAAVAAGEGDRTVVSVAQRYLEVHATLPISITTRFEI